MQENKEKAFSECTSHHQHVKRILLYIVCDKYVAEKSLKTKIWGKRVSVAILRNWKKVVLM